LFSFLLCEYVEVVEPKIRKNFLKLAIARYCPNDLLLDQLSVYLLWAAKIGGEFLSFARCSAT
jgi:hypothetical protein